ncbi:MAG: hypothetical protein KKA73_11380 [Chloroflexi bacterium]|nr:hypothetical protein [Chloroflexota bacterium]MBU1748280.1 hypothetical protein [Chloroflexota bacterium]
MTKYEASRRAWAAYLGVADLDPAVINGHRAALRAWGRWAEKQGQPNFSRHQPDLRLDSYRPRALTRADLLRRLRTVRDQALVYLLVLAGRRAAEAAALQVGDVELSERQGDGAGTHGPGPPDPDHPFAGRSADGPARLSG